jgi:chromate transporter
VSAAQDGRANDGFGTILRVFLRLGLTSFGGPIAHLGYFRTEFVTRRRWLDEARYADLVALAQFLPGPASSQVGFAIGVVRGGLRGGLAAWLGFTLPSALLMTAAALASAGLPAGIGGLVHGLKLVAVAVVAQAVWGMAASLCPDRPRATIAAAGAVLVLLLPSGWMQLAVMLMGTLAGRLLCRADPAPPAAAPLHTPVGPKAAVAALVAFAVLLAGLPAAVAMIGWHGLALAEAGYRAGALVFGGGHVVLPLLEQGFVGPGWIGPEAFLAGYGLAQAVPGPLFTFAAFLGAAQAPAPSGIAGAAIALAAIFLPGLLLTYGMLPFWDRVRRRAGAQAALAGVNAAVVGLLLAALLGPIWFSAIAGPVDVALALAGFTALVLWKAPPWAVVAVLAIAGALATGAR